MIKDALRITSPAADPFLDLLPNAALDAVEVFTGRCILKRTLGTFFDACDAAYAPEKWWSGMREGSLNGLFKTNMLILEKMPLRTIDSVYTYDINDTETLFASTNYRMDNSDPDQLGRLVLNYGVPWPVQLRQQNSIDVRTTAGYDDTVGFAVNNWPPALQMAILKVAIHAYKTRALCDGDTCQSCGVADALSPYIVQKVSA
jgi:hypothetical protein